MPEGRGPLATVCTRGEVATTCFDERRLHLVCMNTKGVHRSCLKTQNHLGIRP